MGSLGYAATALEGKPWPESGVLGQRLQQAIESRPAGLLTAPIPADLARRINTLYILEESWVDEFIDWFDGRGSPDTRITFGPGVEWVKRLGFAEIDRAEVHEAIEKWVLSEH